MDRWRYRIEGFSNVSAQDMIGRNVEPENNNGALVDTMEVKIARVQARKKENTERELRKAHMRNPTSSPPNDNDLDEPEFTCEIAQ